MFHSNRGKSLSERTCISNHEYSHGIKTCQETNLLAPFNQQRRFPRKQCNKKNVNSCSPFINIIFFFKLINNINMNPLFSFPFSYSNMFFFKHCLNSFKLLNWLFFYYFFENLKSTKVSQINDKPADHFRLKNKR